MAKYGSTEQKEKAFRHERALRHTGGLNHVRVLTPAQLKDKNEGSSLLRAAMYGLAIGDSLGVPAEFMGRDSFCIDTMVGGGVHDVPCGTFSDDTSMTLATCDSIKQCNSVDLSDMRSRFLDWLHNGKYAVDGSVFDVGNTILASLADGRGRSGERDNGNGSLMRILPLAFIDGISDEQIEKVSAITHAHAISKRACVIYVHCAKALIDGYSISEVISSVYEDQPFERLSGIAGEPVGSIRSSGYVVDTIEAALWALATTLSFKECVLAAVNLGNDSDTVGAVAGGLAGIVYGYNSIPREWIDKLRGKDIIESVLF